MIYLAGTTVCPPDENKRLQRLFASGYKLHSYFHCSKSNGLEYRWFNMNKQNKVDLFLDSGAFSAWTQGTYINLDEYIKFCLEHLDVVTAIANLDVIPGKPYQQLTQEDIDNSARQGWQNYKKMLKAGIPKKKLVHIFHQGEDFKWLRRMVKQIPYIGLSPANDKTTNQRIHWLDACMDYVVDKEGMPIVKFHGFAATSLRLMLRYPWYSVDSTSWVVTGRMGSIYVPRFRSGEWIYDEDSWKIAVSSRSPNTKEAGKHIETLPPKQKQLVLDYIHSKGYQLGKSVFKTVPAGYELKENERWADKKPKDKTVKRQVEVIEEPGVCNKYQLRDEMNIIYFQDLEQSMPEWPWPFKKKNKIQGFGL